MIKQASSILKKMNSLFVLTGAGISAASGIPTFRGKNGLWKNYRAMDLATPQAFANNPALVWEWYHWRQGIISHARPNAAHYALVDLEKKMKEFLLLTQNVDNLHQRAGSQNVLELHGNIFRVKCVQCNVRSAYPGTRDPGTKIPVCACGGLLRPDVVWFGEAIPRTIWQASLRFLANADTVIVGGTSGIVWPAAALPEIARTKGAKIIEVNLEPTPISRLVDVFIGGNSCEILPELVAGL